MDTLKKLPIFCDKCPTLAFAILDGAPLCEACLLKQIKKTDDKAVFLKIEPLEFAPPQTMHIHPAQNFI